MTTNIRRTTSFCLRPPRNSGVTMKITRRFTKAGNSPYASIPFRRATSEIKNPDGSIVFRLNGFDVPEQFSQVAADILAQKYFRKAGVAQRLKRIEETQIPSWLWRSVPDEAALAALPENERYGGEIRRTPGFRSLGRHVDVLGLEGRLLRHRRGRAGVLRRASLHARQPDGGAELAAVVQHRPALGIRHRRPGQGHFYVDFETGEADAVDSRPTSTRSRTPASFSRSPTTSSTTAASWTSGCAKRASSNTAQAPARISPSLRGAKAKSYPAADARRG